MSSCLLLLPFLWSLTIEQLEGSFHYILLTISRFHDFTRHEDELQFICCREGKINQRADWDEKLQLKTEYKRLKAGESIIKGEMKLAAKCLVEVRQMELSSC